MQPSLLLAAPAQPLMLAAPVAPAANVIPSGPVIALSAWSASTTLSDWMKLPEDVRNLTASAAKQLPYKDSWGKGNHTCVVRRPRRKEIA